MGMFRDSPQAINQGRRRELCRRILGTDTESAECAAADLAALYRTAGYRVMAEAIEAGGLAGARQHARAILRP